MRILESKEKQGWIGIFIEDGNGALEEFYSIKKIEFAEKILDTLRKDLKKLKNRKIFKSTQGRFCKNPITKKYRF